MRIERFSRSDKLPSSVNCKLDDSRMMVSSKQTEYLSWDTVWLPFSSVSSFGLLGLVLYCLSFLYNIFTTLRGGFFLLSSAAVMHLVSAALAT